MTRAERVSLHLKQERIHSESSDTAVPEGQNLTDIPEGVPVFRKTSEGVVEYIKYQGVLYKSILERVILTK